MPFIQFQLRRGTDALWSSTNPVLAAGEMALETNTNRYKFGDGVLAWNSLPYGGTIQENSTFSSITVYQTTTTSNLAFSGKMKITQPLPESIAIGYDNGLNQDVQTIAIGAEAGKLGQQPYSIALGTSAGYQIQKLRAIAIGANAGYMGQDEYAVTIGDGAGFNGAGACSVAIGRFAGENTLHPSTIVLNATGNALNTTKTRATYIAPIATRATIGNASTLFYDNTTKEVFAGPAGGSVDSNYSFSNLLVADTTSTNKLFTTNISTGVITTSNIDATWMNAGVLMYPDAIVIRQQTYLGAVSIGYSAGAGAVGSVAIGNNAGVYGQTNAIAIGYEAGYTQGSGAVAIGSYAGAPTQGSASVALGNYAGGTQGSSAVAIGNTAASISQQDAAIAIGTTAGYSGQSTNAIAIGTAAGQSNQGANSIAIGNQAATSNQHSSTIVLNATGFALQTDKTRATYIAPVATRTNPGTCSTLYYDASTKEVFAGPVPNGGGGFVGSNIGFSNVGILDTISSTSTFTNYFSAAQAYVSSLVVGSAYVVGSNTLVVYGSTILAGPTVTTGPLINQTVTKENVLVATVRDVTTSAGTIQYSTDNGFTWNVAQSGGFPNSKATKLGADVAYGTDLQNSPLFVAVGSANLNITESIQTSQDGKNWTPVQEGGTTSGGISIAYKANTWVGSFITSGSDGNSTIQISKDGAKTFSAAQSIEPVGMYTTRKIALKDADFFVAVGNYDNGSTIMYTENGGTNWYLSRPNNLGEGHAVAYGNKEDGSDLWVAAGRGPNDSLQTSSIQWSTDGITWNSSVEGGFTWQSKVTDVAYLSTASTRTWLAVAEIDGNNDNTPIKQSSDGSNWVNATPTTDWGDNCVPISLASLTWTGSQWFAFGSNTNYSQSYYTTDESGATGWISLEAISSNMSGAAYGQANFIQTTTIGGSSSSNQNLVVSNSANINSANISTLTASTIICYNSTIVNNGTISVFKPTSFVAPLLSNSEYPWPTAGSTYVFSNTQADSVTYELYVSGGSLYSTETFAGNQQKVFTFTKPPLAIQFSNTTAGTNGFYAYTIENGTQIGYGDVNTNAYQADLYFTVQYPPEETVITKNSITTSNIVASGLYLQSISTVTTSVGNFSTLYYDTSSKVVVSGPTVPVVKAGTSNFDADGKCTITFNSPFTTKVLSAVATYYTDVKLNSTIQTNAWSPSTIKVQGDPELIFSWIVMGD